MLPEVVSFQKWLRRKRPGSATARHYTSDARLFFAWFGKPPGAVTLHDVDAYIEHCQTLGHATATINRRLYALHTFYVFLGVERDDAPANPVLARRHYIHQGRRLPRDVEDAQITRLFALITHPRDRAMFLLMLRCGLRVGEVQALSLGDLYLQPDDGQLPRLFIYGKGGYERVAYLCPQVLAALDFWLRVRPKNVRAGAGDAVFVGRFGERLLVNGIQRCLARYCRRAGMWITCHQFRHTFARHMTQAGMPVTSLQRLLGHERLRSTQIYIHVSDPQVQADYRAAIAKVIDRLEGEPGGAA
jgi:site-specific recombinase XerD